ncbi:MAG TPA: roadblock/LC7 domain-containing protein [Candidatus Methylomirabilis sp.]|nr:roadblock/LC7 domain-containing protein [Candidatus Methylomirabilis sp.]
MVSPGGTNLIILDEDFKRINACLSRLNQEARSKAVFLIDKNGQLISSHGETAGLDTTSLASLTAGNIAATGGLAQLLGEKEFSILFHEGERDNLHISIVAQRVILVIIFDSRSSLGLVRLRVKKAAEDLTRIFADIMKKLDREAGQARAMFGTHFSEITDDDIDNLFTKG